MSSVSELFLCPFPFQEIQEVLRAAKVVSISREVTRNTFPGKRRWNQGHHLLKEISISLTDL